MNNSRNSVAVIKIKGKKMKKIKKFTVVFTTLVCNFSVVAFVNVALRKFHQTLKTEAINELLTSSEVSMTPSVSGYVSGYLSDNVMLEQAKMDSFDNNPAVISPLVDLQTTYDDHLTLSFKPSDPKLVYSGDINNLAILKYDGSDITVANTYTDIDLDVISSEIEGKGIYFVADLDGFLKGVGIDVFENRSEPLTNDGTRILLDNYQIVELSAPVSAGMDTDGDGLSDSDELLASYEKDLGKLVNTLLAQHSLPEETFTGEASIMVQAFASSPVLPDTDFDGINDSNDLYPNNNSFAGQLNYKRSNTSKASNVEFTVDYRNFFSGNQVYSKNIAVFSSLLSADIYDESYVKVSSGVSGGSDNATSLGTLFGLSHVEDIKIQASSYTVDKDDLTEFVIGHRLVEYQGTQKEIVIISVRGTNGTNEEWSSNFDVGADTAQYYSSAGSSHPDWKNKMHHKGFDVAANRILTKVNDYFTRRGLTGAKNILVTGHSRGAAIANLLGAHFENTANVSSYAYTFAAPNTTTVSNASSYKTIFNIINSDDIIPALPLDQWGFSKYGTVRSISVSANYESTFDTPKVGTFEWLVGEDYNDDGGTQRTISSFAALSQTRAGIYVLDSTADGKVWQNNLGHVTLQGAETEMSQLKTELQNEKLLKYCNVYIVGGGFLNPYHVEINYSPAYLMQDLANLTTGKCAHLLGHDVKGKYATAKASFIASSGKVVVGGMEDPHLPVTYYLIARNNFAAI